MNVSHRFRSTSGGRLIQQKLRGRDEERVSRDTY
jgi:hypothetical protein